MRFFSLLTITISMSMLAVFAARFVFALPSIEGNHRSSAVAASPDTYLGRGLLPHIQKHEGSSGVIPLNEGTDAFATRMLLARAAEHSIDARYYIWDNDYTGLLLLEELRKAAMRGVRVRLLVDDNGTPELDPELALLNRHSNFEVRVFNPFNFRYLRLASYLFDFPRLNRRMHNKSFSVDGVATIVGGRNVGDAYFGRSTETQFSDFDLLLIGQAAVDVARDFDAYWASNSAYPHELLVQNGTMTQSDFESKIGTVENSSDNKKYADALAKSSLIQSLFEGSLKLSWSKTTLFSDDPKKGLGLTSHDDLLISSLLRLFEQSNESIDLVSAYFVPGDQGTRGLTAAAKKGMEVQILTNSMAATDVFLVHAMYAKYRARLLAGGVDIYELRNQTEDRARGYNGFLGSSSASLHTKTFVMDSKRVFVGSFNLDPRSTFLNCEMGFLIESPDLAKAVKDSISISRIQNAWHVKSNNSGRLTWQSANADGQVITQDVEPQSTLFQRLLMHMLGIAPIEWLM